MPSELYYPSGSASLYSDTFKTAGVSSPNNLVIWTPVSGKSIIVYTMVFTMSAIVANEQLTLKRNSTVFLTMYLPDTAERFITFENGLRIFSANDTISISLSAAGFIAYSIYGTEV